MKTLLYSKQILANSQRRSEIRTSAPERYAQVVSAFVNRGQDQKQNRISDILNTLNNKSNLSAGRSTELLNQGQAIRSQSQQAVSDIASKGIDALATGGIGGFILMATGNWAIDGYALRIKARQENLQNKLNGVTFDRNNKPTFTPGGKYATMQKLQEKKINK